MRQQDVDVDVRASTSISPDRRELVEQWERAFQRQIPPYLSRSLIERSLAHQLQVRRHGAISKKAKAALQSVAKSKGGLPPVGPAVGAKLIREWHGVLHVVEVTRKGFEYHGKSYRSLTAVAEVITGTHWPGPRFFGLRRRTK